EVVVFEELLKDGKVVTTHADINDKIKQLSSLSHQ
ncbi:hypothetical protein IKS_02419, partial [Bacillus cereus VDM062]